MSREDKANKRLLFACRNCEHVEAAEDDAESAHRIYENKVNFVDEYASAAVVGGIMGGVMGRAWGRRGRADMSQCLNNWICA